MRRVFYLLFFVLLTMHKLIAQEKKEDATPFYFGEPDSTFSLIRESPITINLEEEEEEEKDEKKKKKRKKKVFYGVKTKKGFTRMTMSPGTTSSADMVRM